MARTILWLHTQKCSSIIELLDSRQSFFFFDDDMYKIQKRKVLIWTQLVIMSNFRLGRMHLSLFRRDRQAIFSVINGTSLQLCSLIRNKLDVKPHFDSWEKKSRLLSGFTDRPMERQRQRGRERGRRRGEADVNLLGILAECYDNSDSFVRKKNFKRIQVVEWK